MDANTATASAATARVAIERHLAAAPSAVWAAWTEPARFSEWFGPPGNSVISAEFDCRPGGRYRVVMRSPDNETYGLSGQYEAVDAPHRLVFTWAWDGTPDRVSRVSVELAAAGDGTRLTLVHDRFADDETAARHESGWGASLDQLAQLLSA